MSNLSKKPGIRLAVIPFSGFYHSMHDHSLDYALEQMFSDDRGDPNEGLTSRAWDLVKWGMTHELYARAYVENFASEFEVPMTFDELNSPREYNFVTDRIFVEVSVKDVRRVYDEIVKVRRLDLVLMAKEMFTSRSGFSSFYSPDIESWGEVESWDHNQLLCLFQTLVGEDFDSWKQHELMEYEMCNGGFDRMLEKAMCTTPEDEAKAQRLWKISHYLCQREERRYVVSV